MIEAADGDIIKRLRQFSPSLKRFSDEELILEYKRFKSDGPVNDADFCEWVFMTDG